MEFKIMNEIEKDDKIILWNKIIHPQYFYEEEIYYEWFKEVIPYKKSYFDNLSEKGKKEYINDIYQENNGELYNALIYDNNDLLGWVCWSVKTDNKGKKYSVLKYIIVDETKHNKGIGNQIMKFYLNWCFSNNIKKSKLAFNYFVDGLKQFYTKWGFKGPEPMATHTTWIKSGIKEIKRMPKSKK